MCTTSHINQPEEPGHPEALEAHDGVEPRDGRHAAEIAIGERRRLLAVEPALDRVGRVDPRLHGDLGDPGEVVQRHHVADREHLGMTRQGAVVEHRDPAGPVARRPARLGEQARPAARPAHRPPRSWCGRRAAPTSRPPSAPRHRTRRPPSPRSRSGWSRRAAAARCAAFSESRSPNAARISLPPSTSTTCASAGSIRRKLPPRPERDSSAIWPAISTPVGTAADDDEGQPGAARLGVVLALGHLERAEDPAPQLQGVVDRLHARARSARTRRDRSTTARRRWRR